MSAKFIKSKQFLNFNTHTDIILSQTCPTVQTLNTTFAQPIKTLIISQHNTLLYSFISQKLSATADMK